MAHSTASSYGGGGSTCDLDGIARLDGTSSSCSGVADAGSGAGAGNGAMRSGSGDQECVVNPPEVVVIATLCPGEKRYGISCYFYDT